MGFRSLIFSVACLILAVGAGVWCLLSGWYWPAGVAGAVTLLLVYRILSIYGSNVRKLNYLLSAFENGDLAFHFAENSTFLQDRVFNILLNRVRDFVSGQRRLRDDSEAFHRAVENLSRTGLLGVGPKGEVRCYNKALASVLGRQGLHSLSDLDTLMPGIVARIEAIEEGGVLEIPIGSEMRIYNFCIERRTVMDGQTPVRIFIFEEKAESRSEAEQSESVQWQKMTRIISHEVLNTITPIVSLSDTLLGMTDDRNVREGIQVIGESARGLLGFVNGYRALSRVPVPQIHPFRFRTMLDYVLSPLLPKLKELGGHVEIVLEDEDMVLFADEQLMRQVIANILKNALNAIRDRFGDGGGSAAGDASAVSIPDDVPLIRITAFVNASDNTEIHISNNGDPIPPENADHIFDPFFTTRAEGTGVGLALSRQIMRAHAGSIRLDTTDASLTTFVLTL
ncbi:putative uncharacterized protein [Alistipes sp. CAG:831]|nr:putative uncharacterized protein [Alistipes sp. CAG:831]